MNFKDTDYREFLLSIKAPFVFFPAIADDKPTPGRKVYLRHDIDMRIDHAVLMARIEAEMGIRSTYFVLDTASYFLLNIQKEITEIQSYGHEIGWHNDAVQAWYLTGRFRPIREFIETPLKKLRDYGAKVRGTAGHFVAHENELIFHNYNIWKLKFNFQSVIPIEQFDLSEFGLEYETYYIKNNIYFCDSGNEWNHNPVSVVQDFNSRENYTMQLLIHPQWWSV
jgi:hypothetical protein